jgi:hypothetical protein
MAYATVAGLPVGWMLTGATRSRDGGRQLRSVIQDELPRAVKSGISALAPKLEKPIHTDESV